jgi:hypothetical protein
VENVEGKATSLAVCPNGRFLMIHSRCNPILADKVAVYEFKDQSSLVEKDYFDLSDKKINYFLGFCCLGYYEGGRLLFAGVSIKGKKSLVVMEFNEVTSIIREVKELKVNLDSSDLIYRLVSTEQSVLRLIDNDAKLFKISYTE